MLIDTHCHLNHEDFSDDMRSVLSRAEEAGVEHIICAGYDLDSSLRAVDLARQYPMVRAVVGVHPHDARTFTPEVEGRIRELASGSEGIVGIGETGLDYHYNLSPPEVQQEVFRKHIRLAWQLELPLVVHSRDAQSDVLAILKEEGFPERGVVMHCLPADLDFAEEALKHGCYLGIAGAITFKNAQALRDIVRTLPIKNLLLETDAPYLTPHPHRGKRNEPSYLPIIAEKLAEIKGLTQAEIAQITTSNARKLF